MKDLNYLNNKGKYIAKWKLKGRKMLVLENINCGHIIKLDNDGNLDYQNGNFLFVLKNNKIIISSDFAREKISDYNIKEIISILNLDGEIKNEERLDIVDTRHKILEDYNNIENETSILKKKNIKNRYNKLIEELLSLA